MTRVFWFLRTRCLQFSCGSGLAATSSRWAWWSCGLRTESCTRNTIGAKTALGPPPPFCETPTGSPPKKRKIWRRSESGQNQVPTRFRSDFDPISIRFRPDFDPISTRLRKRFFGGPGSGPDAANGPDFDPICTRFRPDSDPTLIRFSKFGQQAAFHWALGCHCHKVPMSGVLNRCTWVAQAVVGSMESARQSNSISAKV